MSADVPGLLVADTLLVTDGSASALLEVSPEEALSASRVLRDAARSALNAEGEYEHR